MSESPRTVLYEASDSIARLTLNRPAKRNALNPELIAELKTALRRAESDQNVRVVVLSGAGSDFCSGADLAALQQMSGASVAENLEDASSLMELFVLIRQLTLPVIAAVRGRALAGGCGLAIACDLVLSQKSARFGFPEVKIGFVPAMVMAILRRNVSEKKAFELIALGETISAAEALSLGLVNRAFEDDQFDSQIDAFLQRLSSLSPAALGLSKSLLYSIDSIAFIEALAAGVDVNVTARLSDDCKKGIAQILKKD